MDTIAELTKEGEAVPTEYSYKDDQVTHSTARPQVMITLYDSGDESLIPNG